MSAVHPTIMQSLKPFMPNAWPGLTTRRPSRGDTAQITFMGFDLLVELDYQGTVEGILNAQGDDCLCVFQDWAISKIQHLANAKVRREHQLSMEPS